MVDVLVVVAGLVVLAWYLSWTATRLDRLHGRTEGAWAALDAQLLRRSSTAHELASSGLLDPASALLLAAAALEARQCPSGRRELAESDLSQALRAAVGDAGTTTALRVEPVGAQLLDEVSEAAERVVLARSFYNDAVTSTRALRAKRVVRWFRLAGHAEVATPFDMDDLPPGASSRLVS
ncbi:MAG: hypothetical protein ACYCXA_10465 [Actinomycetes bacterium]